MLIVQTQGMQLDVVPKLSWWRSGDVMVLHVLHMIKFQCGIAYGATRFASRLQTVPSFGPTADLAILGVGFILFACVSPDLTDVV